MPYAPAGLMLSCVMCPQAGWAGGRAWQVVWRQQRGGAGGRCVGPGGCGAAHPVLPGAAAGAGGYFSLYKSLNLVWNLT